MGIDTQGEVNVFDLASLSTVLCFSMYCPEVVIWFDVKTKLIELLHCF